MLALARRKSFVGFFYYALALTLVYVAALSFFVPEILSPTNLRDIFLQILPLFIAALGLMMVLMVAQIDLSATSIMAMGCEDAARS